MQNDEKEADCSARAALFNVHDGEKSKRNI